MRSFRSSPEFDGFSRVVIIVSDEIEYAAGTDSGRTLRLTCPWGTPEMAQNILESIRGFQYQPYTAEGAMLDPAAELGDGVTANNVYGGIYTKKIKFGSLLTATVAAPEDEEINHEYPYKSKPNKAITREAKMLRASLAVESARISAEVRNRESAVSEVYAALTIQANRITQEVKDRQDADTSLTAMIDLQSNKIEAKVSKTGGNASSFGWALTDSDWTIKGNNREILKATKNGLEVYGKITATSGKIGGFDILSNYLSYNNQTWGGTNSTGIYAGPQGIQCGSAQSGIQLTNNGYLYAEHGEFRGSVRAKRIQYGGDDGYLSGNGISSGSIPGNRMIANTISTAYTSTGINAALADGTWAANILSGVRDYNASIRIGTVSCTDLYQNGYGFSRQSKTFKDYNGNNVTIAYWGW